MKRKSTRSNNSGQALIIASLVITMLLLSTVYYVFEINKEGSKDEMTFEYAFLATKLSATNAITSALANISNGGEPTVLLTDLSKLASVIRNHYYETKCDLSSIPLNVTPYQDGIRISWNSNGSGITSAYVDFVMNFSELSTQYDSEYSTNITTTLNIEGTSAGSGNVKSVNVTCRMYNEGEPALANSIRLFYQNETEGSWTVVDLSNNLNTIDYGNGTYFMSFNVYAQNSFQISARSQDLRDIFVVANTTCSFV